MHDIENIEEESREDRKSESLPDLLAGPEEVNENNLPTGQAGSHEQVIGSTELQTTNLPAGQAGSKPQTEQMEVHHHPKVEKKKFKEYFLEFLMIFLAVTLGFFAENIREHQVEATREVKYIKSLTEDLDDDVQNLDSMIAFEETGLKELDTLIDLLDDPALAKQNGDELYFV